MDEARFQKEILSKYFKTNHFNSFIRQLNLYGFHKVKTENTKYCHEFVNEDFTKDEPNKLLLIKRKNKKKFEVKGNEIQVRPNETNLLQVDTKPMTLNAIKEKTQLSYDEIVLFQKNLEQIQQKFDFVNYCQKEFMIKNSKIKQTLNALIDQENNLQNIFLYSFRAICPGTLGSVNAVSNEKLNSNSLKDLINQVYISIQNYLGPNQKLENLFSNPKFKTQLIGDEKLQYINIDREAVEKEIKFYDIFKDFSEKYLNDSEDLNIKGIITHLKKKRERSKSEEEDNNIEIIDNISDDK